MRMKTKVKPYYIGKSTIHGKGIFAATDLAAESDVGLGIIFQYGFIPHVTAEPGSMINHSYEPNTDLLYKDDGWHIYTTKAVKKDTELTLDYNYTPWYIQGPLPHYK